MQIITVFYANKLRMPWMIQSNTSDKPITATYPNRYACCSNAGSSDNVFADEYGNWFRITNQEPLPSLKVYG